MTQRRRDAETQRRRDAETRRRIEVEKPFPKGNVQGAGIRRIGRFAPNLFGNAL